MWAIRALTVLVLFLTINSILCRLASPLVHTEQKDESNEKEDILAKEDRSWNIVGREEQIIIDKQSSSSDGFGTSVATNGYVVVVGAPSARTETGIPSGAAYVFRQLDDVWVREAKLGISSTINKDYFGWSVAIEGAMIAVGAYLAYGDISSVGLVYIYVYDRYTGQWNEDKVL